MSDLTHDRVYAEICSDIRATDDISFKLMGIVPLVSGASVLTFFLKESLSNNHKLVAGFALFAALITLGLFRWELRNIQKCSWLRKRAEELESGALPGMKVLEGPKPPLRIGKTEAEKWIYSVTIVAWLFVPRLVSGLETLGELRTPYIAAAILIAGLTGLSAVLPTRFEPDRAEKTRR
jgi:hypothetical protein